MRSPEARLWMMVSAVTGMLPLRVVPAATFSAVVPANAGTTLLLGTGPLRNPPLLHRPHGFGDGGLGREDGDELAADILQQHRIGVVVLAHVVELDALPGHDGLLTGDVSRHQRLANLVAVGGFGAVDGLR